MAFLVAALTLAPGASQAFGATLEALSVDPAWVPKNTAPASALAVIRGIGFTPATTVKFDAASATVTYLDSRTLRVQVPTSTLGKQATVTVSDGALSDGIYPFIYTDANLYVKTTGNDSSNGSTPALAKRTIGAALSAASTSTTTLIRVAAGTYNESALALPTGVVLSGGWDTTLLQHDVDQFVTVLDAGRAAFAMRSFGLDSGQIVDGLTIRNGVRDGLGGGGFVISGDNTVISNSVLAGNVSSSRGGAVYAVFSTAYGGTPILSKNVMVGNRSYSNFGGAISIYPFYTQGQIVDVAVSDNFIVGNRSFGGRGGGIGLGTQPSYSYNVMDLSIVGNVISGNRAMAGGAVSAVAGGVSDHYALLVDNNLVFNNSATGEGGGILLAGPGRVGGRVSGNTIVANTAGVDGGGGIRFSPTLTYDAAFEATNLIVWSNLNMNLAGSALATFSDIQGGSAGTGNISTDPGFVAGPMGHFYLEQDANAMSPAVNAGGGLSADFSMESQTTNASLAPDAGLVDMGFHYPLGATPSPDPISVTRVDPAAGDLAGSDWVLIRGRGFDPGATATFAGAAATEAIYVSPTRLLAQPPAHALGPVDVVITNPDATFATLASGYQYADNLPPQWPTTVGLQQVLTGQDCLRSATLTWNAAVDAVTPPVRYSIYRETCQPTTNNFQNPCTNTGYVPGPTNFVATTTESFYTDTNFGTGGADPKIIYLIRAADSVSPVANTEFNYSKRIVVVTKNTSDTTPPPNIGETLNVSPASVLDWVGSAGAVSYRLYRTTLASAYSSPGTLTPLITLTTANNDLDGNGVTDTQYTDAANPAANQIFFYKVTGLDRCNNESVGDLGP
jgi:hypothetical protein